MKSRVLIIIGIVTALIFLFFVINYDNTLDDTPYDIEIQFDAEEYSVIYFVVNGNTDNIEIDIPLDMIDGVFMVYVNDQIVDDERIILDGNKIIVNYGQNIESVKLMGSHDLGGLENENVSLVVESDEESIVYFCAYIGFEKYPDNLFADFLENQYNKDVTFLNFTDTDLKKVPLFYELILEANQLDYPLNDRVSFPVSPDEFFEIKDYLKQRTYFEIKRSGNVIENKIGPSDIYGNYRTPQILIDDKLYRVNGLSGQVFSDKDEILNVSYEWTLEEAKKNLFDDDNPNRANLIYFELNEKDIQNLKSVKNAIDLLHTSDDKIHKSLDVGSPSQKVVRDFFTSENQKQFNDDESKYTRYFILNDTMYETSFVIC